jgi:hypothetical protein
MDKRKWKQFAVSDKINIFVTADANIGTHVDLAWQLGLPVLALKTTVKNHKVI